MSVEIDVYVATSGPYQLAFAADQIESTGPCPAFASDEVERPGVLGIRGGMRVVHPGWFWGEIAMQQPPRHLLVVRSGMYALAVDTCQLLRLLIEPPPPVLAGSGMVFGLATTTGGPLPVFDLACVPLS